MDIHVCTCTVERVIIETESMKIKVHVHFRHDSVAVIMVIKPHIPIDVHVIYCYIHTCTR